MDYVNLLIDEFLSCFHILVYFRVLHVSTVNNVAKMCKIIQAKKLVDLLKKSQVYQAIHLSVFVVLRNNRHFLGSTRLKRP